MADVKDTTKTDATGRRMEEACADVLNLLVTKYDADVPTLLTVLTAMLCPVAITRCLGELETARERLHAVIDLWFQLNAHDADAHWASLRKAAAATAAAPTTKTTH